MHLTHPDAWPDPSFALARRKPKLQTMAMFEVVKDRMLQWLSRNPRESQEDGLASQILPFSSGLTFEVWTRRREGGGESGFGSTRLTAALWKKTAYVFVNQASALAGKGHLSTQPPKGYTNC